VKPFANTIASGRRPTVSEPNHRPVRPKPVMTSSATSLIPCRSHSSWIPRERSLDKGTAPIVMFTGSRITQAKDLGPCRFRVRAKASREASYARSQSPSFRQKS